MGTPVIGDLACGKDRLTIGPTMRLANTLKARLRSLFRRSRVELELDEELRYHIDRQTDENIASGMTHRDARIAALRDFYGFDQRKEECRDMRGVNLLDNFLQDLRYAGRQLLKNPAFTVTALLMLALGTSASVAIFAFVDAALLKPLPYPQPDRLVGVYEQIPRCTLCNLSYYDFRDWQKLNKVFSSLDAYNMSGFILTTPSGVEPSSAAKVSSGFLKTLGVAPMLGRDFQEGEDQAGAGHVVLLSYASWKTRFGGRPEIVGQTVTLDGAPYTIIGVLPASFSFAPVGAPEFWTTLDPSRSCESRRSCHNLYGIARLKDGVSISDALADTRLIAQQLERQYPDSNKGQGANVVTLSEVVVGDVRPILLALLGGAGLLLLIACVNVASLLLVRSESRKREIAVRQALGASRGRLVEQFITEGLLVTAVSSLVGLFSAFGIMKVLVRLIPRDMLDRMPFMTGIGLNLHVVAFTAGVAVLSALIFAITPSLRVSAGRMHDGLIEGSRGSAGNAWRRVGSKLVILELATAMVLLVGAALLGQSLYRLLHVQLGFNPDRLGTMGVGAPNSSYSKDEQQVQLAREVIRRVSQLPGVESVATTSVLPVSFNGNTQWIRFVGRPYNGEHNEVNGRQVSSEYLKTIEARLIRGRYFTDDEDSSKPGVAIINEALANKYFPGEDPIGKQYGNTTLDPSSLKEIIGVVANIRDGSLDSEIWPTEYVPFNQEPDSGFALVVRSAQNPKSILPLLPEVVHQIDRGIVTANEISMNDRIANSPSAYMHRSSAWLVGGFAGIALLLSVIGLYGVVAYSVSQRKREIGVRMALGAERRSVYSMVLKEAGFLTGAGIAGGIVFSLAAATLMRSLLFGVQSRDVKTLIAVAVVLGISALVASYLPARRAASVNPVEALRSE